MSLTSAGAAAAVTHRTIPRHIEEFNNLHTKGVLKDFLDADSYYDKKARRSTSGKSIAYRLVVTPQRVALNRRNDSSSVRVDLKDAGCKQHNWLRNLYRTSCPAGMFVEFGYDRALKVACGDHLEDIFMLAVIFKLDPRSD